MRDNGHFASEAELLAIIRRIDTDGDAQLNLTEFSEFLRPLTGLVATVPLVPSYVSPLYDPYYYPYSKYPLRSYYDYPLYSRYYPYYTRPYNYYYDYPVTKTEVIDVERPTYYSPARTVKKTTYHTPTGDRTYTTYLWDNFYFFHSFYKIGLFLKWKTYISKI